MYQLPGHKKKDKKKKTQCLNVHARCCGTGKLYQNQILSLTGQSLTSFLFPLEAPLFTLHVVG